MYNLSTAQIVRVRTCPGLLLCCWYILGPKATWSRKGLLGLKLQYIMGKPRQEAKAGTCTRN